MYTFDMKHVHLILDETLLEEAVKASGERTYTATVTRGLEELTRLAKIRGLFALAGAYVSFCERL